MVVRNRPTEGLSHHFYCSLYSSVALFMIPVITISYLVSSIACTSSQDPLFCHSICISGVSLLSFCINNIILYSYHCLLGLGDLDPCSLGTNYQRGYAPTPTIECFQLNGFYRLNVATPHAGSVEPFT
ncbi:hypothetical protein P154DRAFT_249002 [Amniculicola lignicola CBS 123094]|uniref:Uncharacterized protein n=1 Tax=Amniculicola lignicola CBS 123094 TaxID=1392246 RepID=A0A6A5WEL3_9PLEO|nr:hypothetical protein P154DRAFT_249002 [Amniculicola lignicola CBS 123094]